MNPALLELLGARAAGGASAPTFLAYDYHGAQASPHTFAVPLGAEHSTRTIVLSMMWRGGGGLPSAVTIGGVTATRAASVTRGVSGAAVYAAAVPTGTSGNVVVTIPGGESGCGIACYRMSGGTVTCTDWATATSAPASLNVDTAPGDLVVGACYNATLNNTFTWTGLTPDSAAAPNYTFASAVATATETRTVSLSTTDAYEPATLAATFHVS